MYIEQLIFLLNYRSDQFAAKIIFDLCQKHNENIQNLDNDQAFDYLINFYEQKREIVDLLLTKQNLFKRVFFGRSSVLSKLCNDVMRLDRLASDSKFFFRSNAWTNMRNRVLQRDFNKCNECPSRYNLSIHHITSRIDNTMKNLVTLCIVCHRKEHINLTEKSVRRNKQKTPLDKKIKIFFKKSEKKNNFKNYKNPKSK